MVGAVTSTTTALLFNIASVRICHDGQAYNISPNSTFYTSISFSRSFLVGFSTLIYCLILHGWFGPHHDHGLRIRRASRQLSSISAPLARVFTYRICPHTLELNFNIFSRRQSFLQQTCMQLGLQFEYSKLFYSLLFCSILSYRRFCVDQSYLRFLLLSDKCATRDLNPNYPN